VADADVNALLRERCRPASASTPSCSTRRSSRPPAAHAERAARAYKDINRLALMLLAPGGLLFSFSCSGGIAPSCSTRSSPARRSTPASTAPSCERLEAAPDHPATLRFPEGEYLKGLVIVRR
jgi:23S rRNA (cytosine1962-C5)-methyltransferase